MITRLTLALVLVAASVQIPTKTYAKVSNQKPLQNSDIIGEQTLFFQGFEPKTKIDFTILSANGLVSQGSAEADENGNFSFKQPHVYTDNANYIVYDFKIVKDQEYLDILVRHDLSSGRITVSGDGLQQFSDVALVTPKQTLTTKSDWVGAFNESNVLGLTADQIQSPTQKESETFKIALNGFANIGAFGTQQNPAIIKILSAPNGGQRGSSGVNSFSTSPTKSSGKYPLSTGNAASVNASITAIKNNYIVALMLMTEQLSAVVMQQTLAIGQFFDAKQQLETQRTQQALKAEAVKDYHPSEQMCSIGSYVRSIANTEQKSEMVKLALNDAMMERYKNQSYASSSQDISNDLNARLKQFREIYCNVKDADSGLDYMCEHDQDENIANSTAGSAAPGGIGGTNNQRFNKDVDFYKTLDFPLTLDIDLQDGVNVPDEEDVLALAKNLYWPTPVKMPDDRSMPDLQKGFLDTQRVIALKNLAHNSYTNLAAMKARADKVPTGSGSSLKPGWTFMKTLMREFGMPDNEIEQLVGVEPSYWAQMDILTKKLYQLPSFYTNLYDKPVNVERIGVALDAIKLMQMRDFYDSKLRLEMLSSGQLETELVNSGYYSRVKSDLLNK